MFHLVASATPGTLLFRTWIEAHALWWALVRGLAGLEALTLMPNHVHAMTEHGAHGPLGKAMSGFARWRNHHRGERGPVWAPAPPAEPLVDAQKRRRSERYVLLNPCRKGLVDDPLAWPFSTHRDRTGLIVDPVVPRKHDAHRFHRYVSSDPSVQVSGTDLPVTYGGALTLAEVEWAVSAITRTPLCLIRHRGPARTLALHAARVLTDATGREIAGHLGVSLRTVHAAPTKHDAMTRLVARVAKDARFQPLPTGDLRATWAPYRNHR